MRCDSFAERSLRLASEAIVDFFLNTGAAPMLCAPELPAALSGSIAALGCDGVSCTGICCAVRNVSPGELDVVATFSPFPLEIAGSTAVTLWLRGATWVAGGFMLDSVALVATRS